MGKTADYQERAQNTANKAKRAYWESRKRRAEGTAEPGSKARWFKRHPPGIGKQGRRQRALDRKRDKRVIGVLLKSPALWSFCELLHWTHNDLILFVTRDSDFGDAGSEVRAAVDTVRRLYRKERDRLVSAGRIPKRND